MPVGVRGPWAAALRFKLREDDEFSLKIQLSSHGGCDLSCLCVYWVNIIATVDLKAAGGPRAGLVISTQNEFMARPHLEGIS